MGRGRGRGPPAGTSGVQVSRTISRLASKPYPGGQGETGLRSTSSSLREYEDVFPNELPGLPPQRVVDFDIELHPGTSPISMTPHRMVVTPRNIP